METKEKSVQLLPKRYLICKRGNAYVPVRTEELYMFYVVAKVTFVKDRHGNKYIIEKHMSELESELDPALFFRANRRVLLNINAIVQYKPIEYGKIALILKDREFEQEVIVSQVTAPLFKKWISCL